MATTKFSVWQGNIEIIPIDTAPKSSQNGDRFNTCKHRSDTERTKTLPPCCSGKPPQKLTGYVCDKRGIWTLKPEVCNSCPVYEPKA